MVLSLERRLESSASPNDEWLWCLYCERFFQTVQLEIDVYGAKEACPYCSCSGFGVAVWYWNDWSGQEEPGWPTTTAILSRGVWLYDPALEAVTEQIARTRGVRYRAHCNGFPMSVRFVVGERGLTQQATRLVNLSRLTGEPQIEPGSQAATARFAREWRATNGRSRKAHDIAA